MFLKRPMLAVAIAACLLLSLVQIVGGQGPTPEASPTTHVPIALPVQVPSGWDLVTYANFRRRCQEVADMSAANLPMGTGDDAYADACTKKGAFYHPVKRLPKPTPMALAPTPIATPGPDGHVPLPWDLPKNPPKGTDPETYANLRAMCQAIADKAYAHQPIDDESIKECGRAVAGLRALSHETVAQPLASPGRRSLPTPIPTPAGASELGPVSAHSSW
jgi:hypothetical protein